MPRLMPFSANKYIFGSVNTSNLILDFFFNAVSYAKPGAEK